MRGNSEIQLFRLRIAVEAIFCSSVVNKQLGGSSWKEVLPKQPRFHANIPSISFVYQQIFHRSSHLPDLVKVISRKRNAQQDRFLRPKK